MQIEAVKCELSGRCPQYVVLLLQLILFDTILCFNHINFYNRDVSISHTSHIHYQPLVSRTTRTTLDSHLLFTVHQKCSNKLAKLLTNIWHKVSNKYIHICIIKTARNLNGRSDINDRVRDDE